MISIPTGCDKISDVSFFIDFVESLIFNNSYLGNANEQFSVKA